MAHHSETVEPLIVYKALYDSNDFGPNALWVRLLSMFTDEVEVDGIKVLRFEYLG